MCKKEKGYGTPIYQHGLYSINKNSTCHKNPNNLSNIDLIPTNSSIFLKANTIFAGLSEFHKLVLSAFKTMFTKSKLKEIVHRNYRQEI